LMGGIGQWQADSIGVSIGKYLRHRRMP